jgi:hypothetical protein
MAVYNLAGGNQTYRENWDQTRDHLVGSMGSTQKNPVDLAFLQEVASSDEDYPRELIEGLMTNYCESTEVKEERFQADGTLAPEGDDGDIRVYSATRENGDTYRAVFGVSDNPDFDGPEDSYKDRNYGNGLLLGPDFKLRTDENGNLEAGQLRVDKIGNNSESGEPRTALTANTVGPNGEDTTLVSTHFTHDSDADRRAQYEVLFNQHRGDDNLIIGGDFNSVPGDASKGNPSPTEAGLKKVASATNSWDHMLVSQNIEKVKGSDRMVPGGGSDHEMLQVDIKLPRATSNGSSAAGKVAAVKAPTTSPSSKAPTRSAPAAKPETPEPAPKTKTAPAAESSDKH